MALSDISASETDVNSPVSQTLMDKIASLLNQIRALFNGTTGHGHSGATDQGKKIALGGLDTNSVDQTAMGPNSVGQAQMKDSVIEDSVTAGQGTTVNENINLSAGTTFVLWPRVKWTFTGDGTLDDASHINVWEQGYGATVITGAYQTLIGVSVTALGTDAATATVFVGAPYITATKFRPTLWLKRHKITHQCRHAHYDPESNLDNPPVVLKDDERDDFEILVIQLDSNSELKKHLEDNRYDEKGVDRGLLGQLHLGIFTGLIEFKDEASKLYPEEETPCLYHKDAKVVLFEFTKPE